MKNIFSQIIDLQNSGSTLVLATVTGTTGSTPQKPGSSALFGENGLIAGTVGGGIVEGKVQKLAGEAILSKQSVLCHFNLDNDISASEEAICGGQISVLIDAGVKNYISVFEALTYSLENRIPGVLITKVTSRFDSLVSVERVWMNKEIPQQISDGRSEEIGIAFKKLISERNTQGYIQLKNTVPSDDPGISYFLQPFFPPDHLLIAGAGHIGRSLSHLGKLLGFEVTVIDDRAEFANSESLPDADHIVVKDIGEAIHEMAVGPDTFLVIVTRGHMDDASALKQCIGRDLTYIGMIGSKNKIATMKQNFFANGWSSADQWVKIHAPVGLKIKSQTVEEIAISIAAELVMVRNSRR